MPSFWNTPSFNHDFTGYRRLLAQIAAQLFGGSTLVVIRPVWSRGEEVKPPYLAGIGKTELALAYIETYQNNYKNIYWIDASTENHLKFFYLPLINKVKSSKKNLFIFDNASDEETLKPYLPTAGHIIVTTQNKNWFWGSLFSLNVFSVDYGINYVKNFLVASENTSIALLAETLDHMPLALKLACCYIQQTHCTIHSYLHIYANKKRDLLRKKILPEEYLYESVMINLVLITDKILENSKYAAYIIIFCICYEHYNILYALLPKCKIQTLETALELLECYGLIVRNADNTAFNISSVTQKIFLSCIHPDSLKKNFLDAFEYLKYYFIKSNCVSEKKLVILHLESMLKKINHYQRLQVRLGELKTNIETILNAMHTELENFEENDVKKIMTR